MPAYKANNNSLEHYEESDRGPDFVRCALKSCELFKILHLSLPDNMIGDKEMVDIAYVLSRNTPLRTLNLSDNALGREQSEIPTRRRVASVRRWRRRLDERAAVSLKKTPRRKTW